MNKAIQKYSLLEIENRIFTIRDTQVMIDRDIAEMYDVETKVLNQAVKRNIERFPEKFRFQLTTEERDELVTNCDRLETLKHSSSMPYAFTEQGVAMLSAVLKSSTAIQVSLQIMDAFVEMRKVISSHAGLLQRMDGIQLKLADHDQKFAKVFTALESKNQPPKQGVFFNGQTYDAYAFVSDLIRTAKKSIQIIDNYVDDTVLTLLSKRNQEVEVIIYTKTISKQLQLDIEKHNGQYPKVKAVVFKDAHDRFMIFDGKQVYHIGASIKDLGKKWFAFTQLQADAVSIINKINAL
ncbi:ORF6N domain-containing protein [Ostreibacterium oceani]|uniref:ORF6N domain-containing protein n=1 Tax=Ostreibacterium oceani TaxID=2654998 RepID=A0A6N7EX00_9GAMM|nr:ORF6N domain-containing protein [Ostreibacterium oceani]MPV86070.1 ORF6N domain-containing protein [Ostreibacterium oceani]